MVEHSGHADNLRGCPEVPPPGPPSWPKSSRFGDSAAQRGPLCGLFAFLRPPVCSAWSLTHTFSPERGMAEGEVGKEEEAAGEDASERERDTSLKLKLRWKLIPRCPLWASTSLFPALQLDGQAAEQAGKPPLSSH